MWLLAFIKSFVPDTNEKGNVYPTPIEKEWPLKNEKSGKFKPSKEKFRKNGQKIK